MSLSAEYSDKCFDKSTLKFKFNSEKHKWISLHSEKDSKLYSLVISYIAKNSLNKESSFTASITKASRKSNAVMTCNNSGCTGSDCESEIHPAAEGRVILGIGYGQNSFLDFDGRKIDYLHQSYGEPVGTNCGIQLFTTLVLFTDSSISDLSSFLSKLVEESERTLAGFFTCFAWHVKYQYWRTEARIQARPVSSVVLPEATKKRLLDDMEKFLLPSTQSFYNRNGIPYRRSYLFYGLPGTGKTSMVQALAGHFNRNVCYLMPTHPEMTDDSLRSAVTDLPEDAIVVFEDIDSLFAKDRSNKVSKSSLTFSGLLNALDGIGNPSGQIFILTTNLREQLDQALIRNGRVDMHIEFTYAVEEQMQQMWTNFYPSHADKAAVFSQSLLKLLEENSLRLAAAGLQHYFVTMMDRSADEAIDNIGNIITEIRENNSKEALNALQKKAEPAKSSKKKGKSRVDEDEDDDDDDDDSDGEEEENQGKKNGSKEAFPFAPYLLAATAMLSLAFIHGRRY